MTLPRVPTDLTLWPQPWCLTYILKINLGITFQSYVPGVGSLWQNLSMAIDVTTVIKQVIWRCELSVWPIFQKLWCRHGCQWNLSLSEAFVFHKHILFMYQIMIDWLIIYCFTSCSRIFHLYGDVTIAGEGWAAKFRPMLGAQGLWAGRDLYRATPTVTWGLSFSGFIWRTAPFSRLLRHARGVSVSFSMKLCANLHMWSDHAYCH
jgi:hypothetical protein